MTTATRERAATRADRRRRTGHPVTLYAQDVVTKRITAGKWVRLACQRHLEALQAGPASGFYFDESAADHALRFFSFLRQSKGQWAGELLVLLPWQVFVVGSIFGWRRTADGTRRYRSAYIEVARKNGKSTLAAPIGLYLAFFDHEGGAEVYSAATKRDQAKIIWSEASRMVLQSPQLMRKLRVIDSRANIHEPGSASKFEALSADYNSMDGLNIHGAIIDELHAHESRQLWDVLNTATGARRQPLIGVVTTAGFNRHSICWEQHEYACKVLEKIIPDDSVFGYIATLDDGDDWTDERVWIKANPSLGQTLQIEYLRDQVAHAQASPGKQNAVRRLHMNQWTEQSTRAIDIQRWDENPSTFISRAPILDTPRHDIHEADFHGMACFAGLDMSSTSDLTSLGLWIPFTAELGKEWAAKLRLPDGQQPAGAAIWRFWVPQESAEQRRLRDRVPYVDWARDGHIKLTEGNVVDYDVVRQDVNDLREVFNIREIAIDRWNSTQLQTQLMGDGFQVVQFGQGFASMSAPSKEFERMVLERSFWHGGHPVMRWMAENLAWSQDAAGNIKPDKSKSGEKIDGIVAIVMAIGRAMVTPEAAQSRYEGEDVEFV